MGKSMKENLIKEEKKILAEQIKQECAATALKAYEEASLRGLCHEGAWEYAIDAIKSMKVDEVLKKIANE
jgi:hypothetical protein